MLMKVNKQIKSSSINHFKTNHNRIISVKALLLALKKSKDNILNNPTKWLILLIINHSNKLQLICSHLKGSNLKRNHNDQIWIVPKFQEPILSTIILLFKIIMILISDQKINKIIKCMAWSMKAQFNKLMISQSFQAQFSQSSMITLSQKDSSIQRRKRENAHNLRSNKFNNNKQWLQHQAKRCQRRKARETMCKQFHLFENE